MELIVRVPGSCGEIMQGYWQGEPFLVTCPIDRYGYGPFGDGTPCRRRGQGETRFFSGPDLLPGIRAAL